jgi:hypothetical protein
MRHGTYDAFVAELDATGASLVYATYLGGTHTNYGDGIALGPHGEIIVTGYTNAADFPVTPGAFNTTFSNNEVFVVKLGAGLGSDGSGDDGSGDSGSAGSGSGGSDGGNGASTDAGVTAGEPGAPAGCCEVGGDRSPFAAAVLACVAALAMRRRR